jgi:hypothetical protein
MDERLEADEDAAGEDISPNRDKFGVLLEL